MSFSTGSAACATFSGRISCRYHELVLQFMTRILEQCLIESIPCFCALFARGPFLGRQEEQLAELVAERAELQHAADDAGAGLVIKDIISLLKETNVSLDC